MTGRRRTRLALVVALVAVLFVAGRWAFLWRKSGAPDMRAPPLAPWHAGMSLRETFETLPTAGDEPTRLKLLGSNPEAYAERWRLLASARERIDVSYFILHEDAVGVAFLGHLLARARDGVRIRILLDDLGTKMSRTFRGNDYLDELVATGNVTVKFYRPLWIRWVQGFLALSPSVAIASEHDKIIVVDGARSLTGGRNIGIEYFADPEAPSRAFIDTDLRLDGQGAARALARAFEVVWESEHAHPGAGEAVNVRALAEELLLAYETMDHWLRAGTPDPALTARLAARGLGWQKEIADVPGLGGVLAREGGHWHEAEVRVVDSRPRFYSPDDPVTQALARLARSARREIVIETPYLVLSEEGLELLAAAAARGVAITILTNSPVSSDNALSQAFFLEQWPQLLARAPGLRLLVVGREDTLHGKLATFDDALALVGTYNLDPTSMALNSEVMVAAWSPAFTRAVAEQPRRLIARGAPDVYEYTIERDPAGLPVRDAEGRPRIAFGPEDHCDPGEWKALSAYWATLRAAEEFAGFSPLL